MGDYATDRFGAGLTSVVLAVVLAGCTVSTSADTPDPSAEPGTSAAPSSSAPTTTPPEATTPTTTPPPAAAGGCDAEGDGIPEGAGSNETIDVDGDDRPDTQWIATPATGPVTIGITTASGATFSVPLGSISPAGRQLLVERPTESGPVIALASDNRQVEMFVVDCGLAPAVNEQGEPYVFALGFSEFGTGLGCTEVEGAAGRQLVGLNLQSDDQGNPVSVTRTVVTIDGTQARNGPSDTVDVEGDSPADPSVSTARTITCGDRTMANDGLSTGP